MPKRKYVVKVGRQPGIYDTWAECEKQIKGFSGAVYKSFGSELDAQQYLDNQVNKRAKVFEPVEQQRKSIVIYTDGSHFKHVRTDVPTRVGFGGYCEYDNSTYTLSGVCDEECLKRYNISPKTKISKKGDAKSDAHDAPTPTFEPDLQQIINVWPDLPEPIKQAIKALIQTQKLEKTNGKNYTE